MTLSERLAELEKLDAGKAIELRMLFPDTIAHLDDEDLGGAWTSRRAMLAHELDVAITTR